MSTFNCRVGRKHRMVKVRTPECVCDGCFYENANRCHSAYTGDTCCPDNDYYNYIFILEEVIC